MSMREQGRECGRQWNWPESDVPGGPWNITEAERAEFREGWCEGLAERNGKAAQS